ncbi:hypothetical protein HZH68_000780 [Vespula germanica]|uniref:Uncharacterized protein n=1 Tax=Vespula germanica TaxID=30212 RepID=A0A834U6C1_VESGE|nr:hypothetical protein HZH68_000780 [Vespula germanica]
MNKDQKKQSSFMVVHIPTYLGIQMDVESRSVCINQKFTLIYAADVEVNDPCGTYLDLARARHGREVCLVVRPSRGRAEGTCCTGNSVLQDFNEGCSGLVEEDRRSPWQKLVLRRWILNQYCEVLRNTRVPERVEKDNPSYFSLSVSTSSTDTTTSPSSNCPSSSTNHTHRSGGHTGLTALFRRRPTCKMGATSSTSVASASTASTSTNHQESSSHRISGSSGSTPSTPTEERVPMLSRSTGNGTTTINQRRSFRNLFRSVSANDHERTQQFLKGDPRPSDVAPPSPYLPHRSHSHSENDRRRPTRDRRVLKSASELLSNDMVYCGLSGDTNDHDDDDDDDDDDQDSTEEVFLGVDDARYYNLSSTLPSPGSAASGQRRHSVGTFLGKDRNTCSGRRPTQTVEVLVEPSSMAPPIPTDTVDGIVRIDDRRDRSSGCRSRRRRHRSSSSKGIYTRIRFITRSASKLEQKVSGKRSDLNDLKSFSSRSIIVVVFVGGLTAFSGNNEKRRPKEIKPLRSPTMDLIKDANLTDAREF